MEAIVQARIVEDTMSSLRKTGIYLIALVLLPVLVYVTYEIQSLGDDETVMREIYERQLETMLYSVNQHAWDMANSWASALQQMVFAAADDVDSIRAHIQTFLIETPTVESIFITDSLFAPIASAFQNEGNTAWDIETIFTSASALDETVTLLLQRIRADYRQLHPIVFSQQSGQTSVALLFAMASYGQAPKLLSMVLNTDAFVQNVLVPKMQEVARQSFVIVLSHEGQHEPIFTTAPLTGVMSKQSDVQQRNVWLFPDYVVSIRAQAGSIEALIRSRFYRSLALILLLAIALLAGVWMVYRNVHREMELAEMKSTFVSNVSHELRTPLALIRMFAETLEMGRVASDEKRQEYYNIIHQETERLSRLVNNILNFSHIEAGKKTYIFRKVDVNETVGRVVDTYTFNLKKNGFTTKIELSETVPAIRGDSEALTEAVINLIDNAIKYSIVKGHEERSIEIITGHEHGSVFIEVADRGIGIPAEEKAKIFSPFYRISGGLVHTVKGTGLGLALIKHIIDAHDGIVTIKSKPEQGSRFRLTFKAWNDADDVDI